MKKVVVCIKEPSLGPVFGMKDGALLVAVMAQVCGRWSITYILLAISTQLGR